jgi:general secretion pathway protein B
VSYILDALRRADAERQRGGVPGLHDQTRPLAAGSGAAGQSPAAPVNRWALGAGAAVLLALALASAWWLGRGAAPPAAADAADGGPAVAALPGLPAVPAALQVQAGVPAAPPAPDRGRPLSVAALVPPAVPAPVLAAGQPLAVLAVPAPPPARPLAAAPLPSAGNAPADAASDPVRPWASLPDAMRAAMPPLAWSGVVYADRADLRLVVVNGQVAREGEPLATGLQLLQIRPKSVVLRWQGQRIELPL